MKNQLHNAAARDHAFTLVELLVVITIIGVLAGLTLTVLTSVRTKTAQIRCLSNLRQIGITAHLMATEDKDRLPVKGNGATSWYRLMKNRLNGPLSDASLKRTILWRPTFEGPENLGQGIGYGWSEFLNEQTRHFPRIERPAYKVMCGSVEKGDGIYPNVAVNGWNRIATPHNKKAGICFIDGHVALLSRDDLDKNAPARFNHTQ
ncbi:MAG: type II secretion system GspH family protein [Opitutaceae bacterium]|jgi:prepilin-type N-terminal cleavage/methylation domain-containing protein/prepilin-type processing-associated H-X9-DG protein|nr:type II secretion system GspH family protein [Opitutaceae bacterium]